MIRQTLTVTALLGLCACSDVTSSETALRQHGYSEPYVAGFHDGCESGKAAGGDSIHQRVRDGARYDNSTNGDYHTGWDYGFLTCKQQTESDIATAAMVGAILAGAVNSSSHGADGIDVKDALKGVDTSAIQQAGW